MDEAACDAAGGLLESKPNAMTGNHFTRAPLSNVCVYNSTCEVVDTTRACFCGGSSAADALRRTGKAIPAQRERKAFCDAVEGNCFVVGTATMGTEELSPNFGRNRGGLEGNPRQVP